MLFSVYSGRTIVPRSCRIKRCCNRLLVKQNKKCSDCDCVCLKYGMQFMHLTYPKWDKVGFQEVFGWITFPSLGIVNSPNSRWVYEVFPDLVSTWPFTKPWISSQHPTGTRRALKPRSLFGSRRVCELSIQRCSCFRLQRICKDMWQKVHICPVWQWQRVLQNDVFLHITGMKMAQFIEVIEKKICL